MSVVEGRTHIHGAGFHSFILLQQVHNPLDFSRASSRVVGSERHNLEFNKNKVSRWILNRVPTFTSIYNVMIRSDISLDLFPPDF